VQARLFIAVVVMLAAMPIMASEYSGPVPLDREARLKLATRLASGFSPLLEALPVLSPSQAEWLKSETQAAAAARSAERMTNLAYSIEENVDTARKSLLTLVEALHRIERPAIPVREEVLHWSVVANVLASPDLWSSLFVLVGKKALDPERLAFITAPADQFLTTFGAASQAGEIMNRVVIPYLDERLE
jgi:hypothetical protein